MSLIADYGFVLLILACAFGFFMAWGVGANDVANAMGTSVGSKALTIKQAIVIAMIFEFLGAYLAGGEVTATVRKGIVDASVFSETPHYLVYGMLSALLAAGIWLVVASWFGWPVSTTHSIVGAIVGFAAVGVGMDSVHWDKVGSIVASWVTSPLLAGFISFFLIKSVQRLVLNQDDPFQRAKKVVPFYMFMVGYVMTAVTLVKGLKHIGLDISFAASLGWALIGGLIVAVIGASATPTIQPAARSRTRGLMERPSDPARSAARRAGWASSRPRRGAFPAFRPPLQKPRRSGRRAASPTAPCPPPGRRRPPHGPSGGASSASGWPRRAPGPPAARANAAPRSP